MNNQPEGTSTDGHDEGQSIAKSVDLTHEAPPRDPLGGGHFDASSISLRSEQPYLEVGSAALQLLDGGRRGRSALRQFEDLRGPCSGTGRRGRKHQIATRRPHRRVEVCQYR